MSRMIAFHLPAHQDPACHILAKSLQKDSYLSSYLTFPLQFPSCPIILHPKLTKSDQILLSLIIIRLIKRPSIPDSSPFISPPSSPTETCTNSICLNSITTNDAYFGGNYTDFRSTVTIGEEEHVVEGVGRIQLPTTRFPAAPAAAEEVTVEVGNVLYVPTATVNILGGTDFHDAQSVAPPPGPNEGAGYTVAPAAPGLGPTTFSNPATAAWRDVAKRYIVRDGSGLANPSQALGYFTHARPPNNNGTIFLLAVSGPPRGPAVRSDGGFFASMEGQGLPPYDVRRLTADWPVAERARFDNGFGAW